MRAWLFIFAVLAIVSCGGGEAPVQGNNAPAAEEKPPEPPPEWFELKELAAGIHEEFPNLPVWADQIELRKTVKDGTPRLKEFGAYLKQWQELDEDAPDWMYLRAWGLTSYRFVKEKEPPKEAIEKAVAQSSGLPRSLQALSKFDYIVPFDLVYEEEVLRSFRAGVALEICMRRIELLGALGEFKTAEQELSYLVDVLMKCDRNNTVFQRILFGALVQQVLLVVVNGALRENVGSESMHATVQRLREPDSSGFWDAEWGELAHMHYNVGKAEYDPKNSVEEIEADIKSIRARIGLVKQLGGVNLDPTEEDVYGDIKRPFERIDSEFVWSLGYSIKFEVKLRAAWLAYDLVRMDAEAPLIKRTSKIYELVNKVPAVSVDIDRADRVIRLKFDRTHLIFKDANEWDQDPLQEFTMRELPPAEEKQPD